MKLLACQRACWTPGSSNPKSAFAWASNCFDASESDLQTTAEMPALRASPTKIAPALFVNINNGTFGMSRFNSRATSSPFITGMDRSRITRLSVIACLEQVLQVADQRDTIQAQTEGAQRCSIHN
jgi:hypothetical protein